MTSCKNYPFVDLYGPFTYEKVAKVCFNLKLGGSGVLTDHEHVRFARPVWNFLFGLYNDFFLTDLQFVNL